MAQPPMLVEPPAGDGGVVAAQEDLGDRQAAVDARAGVLGIFESSIRPERLVDRALGIAETPGIKRTTASIKTIAATSPPERMIVAHREQLGLEDLDDALVETLVTPTEQNQSWFLGQLGDPCLIEPASLRREHDQAPGRLGGRPHGLGRRHHRRGHQDHPRPAAKRPIVDLLVLPLGPVADVPPLDLRPAPCRSPDSEMLWPKKPSKSGRKQGQHVDAMRRRCGHGGDVRSPVTWRPAAAQASAGCRPAAGGRGAAGSRNLPRLSRRGFLHALLFSKHLHLVRRLRTDREPVPHPADVQDRLRFGIRAHRVVVAQLFDRAPVAPRPRIHGADAEKRAMPASQAFIRSRTTRLLLSNQIQVPHRPHHGQESRSHWSSQPLRSRHSTGRGRPAFRPRARAQPDRFRSSRRRRRSSFSRCFLSFSRLLGGEPLAGPDLGRP